MMSIRKRLLFGLLLTLILTLAAMLWLTWHDARRELSSLFDTQLQQSASIMLLWTETEPRSGDDLSPEKFREELEKLLPLMTGVYLGDRPVLPARPSDQLQPRGDYQRELAFTISYGEGSRNGELILASQNAPVFLYDNAQPGFQEMELADHLWHAYTAIDGSARFVVRVAERDDVRQVIIAHILRRQFGLMLFMLPLAALLVWLVVGRGLQPLVQLGEEIRARREDLLEPIRSDAPAEVRGLVDSLNHLFERLQAAFEHERQFSADTAHELRTPLAALRTRAEVARQQYPQCSEAFDDIIRQTRRAGRVLDQLLMLARMDAHDGHLDREPLDLVALSREVLADLAPQALQRRVEPELESPAASVEVLGEPVSLSMLLKNLVENAIRHSPPDAAVTVHLEDVGDAVHIRVLDQGPGIPPGLREAVLDRYYRGPQHTATLDQTGAGLGLTIVQRIAAVHQATLTLLDGPDGSGLEARVSFPVNPPKSS